MAESNVPTYSSPSRLAVPESLLAYLGANTTNAGDLNIHRVASDIWRVEYTDGVWEDISRLFGRWTVTNRGWLSGYAGQWLVTRVTVNNHGQYPFRVEGTYRDPSPMRETFSWRVPRLDHGYDLTDAEWVINVTCPNGGK